MLTQHQNAGIVLPLYFLQAAEMKFLLCFGRDFGTYLSVSTQQNTQIQETIKTAHVLSLTEA